MGSPWADLFSFMESMWRRAKLTSSRPVPKLFRKGPEVSPGLHQNLLRAILNVKSGTQKGPKQNRKSRLKSSKTMRRGVGSRSAPGYFRRMSGVPFRHHFDTLWPITNAQFEYNSNTSRTQFPIQFEYNNNRSSRSSSSSSLSSSPYSNPSSSCNNSPSSNATSRSSSYSLGRPKR